MPLQGQFLSIAGEKIMPMKLIKKTPEYSIFQRGDERYAVKDAKRKPVNGDEKVSILTAEGLVKAPAPKPAPVVEAPVEELAAEEAAVEAGEEVAAEADAGDEPQA
jgi:hypothetical protein